MYVIRMNPYRFEVLVMWSRAVPQFAPTAECSVWATDDERLLGVGSDNGDHAGSRRGGGCGRDLVCRNRIPPHRTILEPGPIWILMTFQKHCRKIT